MTGSSKGATKSWEYRKLYGCQGQGKLWEAIAMVQGERVGAETGNYLGSGKGRRKAMGSIPKED